MLGLLGIALAIWGALNEEPSAPAPIVKGPNYNETAESLVEAPRPAQAAETPAAIGETFAVGYWAYTVHGASWRAAVPSVGYAAEFPDATFLLVDLSACNEDRTASTLPPFKLVDTEGREYDESSKGSFAAGRFDPLKTMNPGVYSRGYVIFDVPHRSDYRLRVSGGFESGKYRLVDIAQALRIQAGGTSNGNEESVH